MARILCNVAGGGKPLKGNAETGDVLAGKTFSNKQSNALTGTMANQGGYTASKSWARGGGTTYIRIPKGAYLTAANNGLDLPEITVADNLYGQGEYDSNYNSGYTNGHNQGVNDGINSVNIDFFCLWAFESNASNWNGHGYSLWNTLNKKQNSGNILSVGNFGWYGYYNGEGSNTRHGELIAKVNCTIVSNKGTWNLNAGQNVAVSIADGNNGRGDWQGYAYAR
jgi:hypothetical protein